MAIKKHSWNKLPQKKPLIRSQLTAIHRLHKSIVTWQTDSKECSVCYQESCSTRVFPLAEAAGHCRWWDRAARRRSHQRESEHIDRCLARTAENWSRYSRCRQARCRPTEWRQRTTSGDLVKRLNQQPTKVRPLLHRHRRIIHAEIKFFHCKIMLFHICNWVHNKNERILANKNI